MAHFFEDRLQLVWGEHSSGDIFLEDLEVKGFSIGANPKGASDTSKMIFIMIKHYIYMCVFGNFIKARTTVYSPKK